MTKDIDALLAWRGKGAQAIGRDRIAILEAVAAHGSITAAAQALGKSYKTVWDGVNAVNNLLPRPALLTRTGGADGGGAVLTADGEHLVRSFRRLEEKLSAVVAAMTADVDLPPDLLFWGSAMKTSARNAFRCRVGAIERGAVNVELTLDISASRTIWAVITNDSADELGLVPGSDCIALVKSSFVVLAKGDVATSMENRFTGTVTRRIDGGVNSEISLDIGDGKTLTAVITRESADELGLAVGVSCRALFSASQVIVAV